MRNIIKSLSVILFAVLVTGLTGCTRVEPGWVGIRVNQAGNDRGVEDYPLLTGWVFYNPFTQRMYEYPTFQQSVIWCASPNEGRAIDESISFNCKGGAGITADVSTSGIFKTARVPGVFVKFRSSPEVIIHTYLRNEVRDCLSRVASTYDPVDILGEKRAEFLNSVKTELDKRVGDWWTTDYITFANKLRMDPQIENSINSIIQQKQVSAQAELKVTQSKAEADQAAAVADGQRRVKVANAQGEAEAILVKARAQADANTLIAESLAKNPMVLQSIALERWNGVLPQVTGAAIPFIGVNTTSTNNIGGGKASL